MTAVHHTRCRHAEGSEDDEHPMPLRGGRTGTGQRTGRAILLSLRRLPSRPRRRLCAKSIYPADMVRFVRGEARSWTLKRNPRFFCGDCGTRLFIDVLPLKLRGVNGYLLPKDEFRAQFHMQCQFAVAPSTTTYRISNRGQAASAAPTRRLLGRRPRAPYWIANGRHEAAYDLLNCALSHSRSRSRTPIARRWSWVSRTYSALSPD